MSQIKLDLMFKQHARYIGTLTSKSKLEKEKFNFLKKMIVYSLAFRTQ
jgi:hypothetical protein